MVSKPDHENLISLIKKKEIELRRNKRGTLHPVKPNRWKHVSYKGFIDFHKANKDISIFELKQKSTETNDWQLLHSFLGFLDRHCGGRRSAYLRASAGAAERPVACECGFFYCKCCY